MPDVKMVMGLETEYGWSNPSSPDDYDPLHDAMRYLDVPFVGLGSSLFLSNGSRFYIDGAHPEYATPECGDPWTLVAHARAGDRIVKRWLDENVPDSTLSLLSAEVYLSGRESDDSRKYQMSTWGSHESYSLDLDRTPWGDDFQATVRRTLDPHLASRACLCGPGGFVPTDWHGTSGRTLGELKFCMSPRLWTKMCAGGARTALGTLTGYKDIQDNGGGVRMHLMCGDSLCSDVGLFLRFASTSIMLKIAQNADEPFPLKPRLDRGCLYGWLMNPHEKFDGHSAFSMQRELVKFSKQFLEAEWMPQWAARAWKVWGEAVEMAEEGAAAATKRFDWALKKALYENSMSDKTPEEIMEFDVKFHKVGNGIFHAMGKKGLLEHEIVPKSAIERAITTPPSDTRANARGNMIARAARVAKATNHPGLFSAEWDAVWRTDDRWPNDLKFPDPLKADGGQQGSLSTAFSS